MVPIRRIAAIASVALCLCALSPTLRAEDDRAAIEKTVRDFYSHYTQNDYQGLKPFFASKPPRLLYRIEFLLRNRCIEIPRLEIEQVDVRGDSAEVHVSMLMIKRERSGRTAGPEPLHPWLRFVREDGAWKLATITSREEQLADCLVNDPNDADVRTSFAEDPDSLNGSFFLFAQYRILNLIDGRNFPVATRAIARLHSMADAAGSVRGKALALHLEAGLLRRGAKPDFDAAVKKAEEAVAEAEKADDADVLGLVLFGLGRAYEYQSGGLRPAIPAFQRVTELAPRIEDETIVARVAVQLGSYELDRGNYRTAMRHQQLARSVATAVADYTGEFNAELLAAYIYRAEHDFALAREHFEFALMRGRALRLMLGEIDALQGMAQCDRQLGRMQLCREETRQALALAEANQVWDYMASLRTAMARDDLRAGRLDDAEKTIDEATAAAEKSVEMLAKHDVRSATAELRLAQKRYDETIRIADDLTRADSDADTAQRYDAAVFAARAHRALGDVAAAERELSRAIALTEREEQAVSGDERQMSLWFESRSTAFVELVDLLVSEQRVREALEIADRAKGRALLDLLRTGGHEEPELTPDEGKQKERLETALFAANRNLQQARAAKRADVAALEGEVAAKRVELDSFRSLLDVRHPRLALRRGPSTGAGIDDILESLPTATALVEYVITDERLHIFTARRSGGRAQVAVHTVPVSKTALAADVSSYVAKLASRRLEYRDDARGLYKLLLAPVASEIGSKTVLIIPDGPLWKLPLESLILPDGRFAIERQAMFYAPSAAIWKQMAAAQRSRRASAERFLAFANPRIDGDTRQRVQLFLRDAPLEPLPDAEREVKAAAALFGRGRSRLYIGAAAEEEKAKEEARRFEVVHFATHAIIDDGNPMYSHLVLARAGSADREDGLLEAWEMMSLDLDADLTVLSACDTARGGVHPGEGLMGMTWALFAAGCPSTIASEWKVSSPSTATLMIDFYRHWLRSGHPSAAPKAEALRQARLAMIRDPARRHPFYWAAFVLLGVG